MYVVFLRNPSGDGTAGYYVGMTGLTPEKRFEHHKAGIKASSLVRRFGERLVPKLYEHLQPMAYSDALTMEKQPFEKLKARGLRLKAAPGNLLHSAQEPQCKSSSAC